MSNLWGIFANIAIRAAFFGWLIAQGLKIPINKYIDGTINWKRTLSSGGMPSSHTSAIVATATSVGMVQGFDSPTFAVAAVMAIVVMYDAAGVRRAAGKHAVVLNEIIALLRGEDDLNDEKLKEWIGHSPLEVFIGLWLGILVGIAVTLISVAVRHAAP